MMPSRLRSPCVGFRPTMPFGVDGPRIDPPVSVPMPIGAYAAAIATPVPPEEPDGVRVRSCGFAGSGRRASCRRRPTRTRTG